MPNSSPSHHGTLPQGDATSRKRPSALQLGPRKKMCGTDPLVHHGRHFGRTVHALCNLRALITAGLLRMVELEHRDEGSFTFEERREHRIFERLLQSVPGLEEKLAGGSNDLIYHVADLIQKGSSSARADDTKALKSAVIDWITPRGETLYPPLARNGKADRGFHHERTGGLLCPTGLDWSDEEVKTQLRSGELAVAGDQWPVFLYSGTYNPEDPWQGLFRGPLLIKAYKHIFTSPSSVEKEMKATRSGNALIHGMTRVSPASLAYIATQVRFALCSTAAFSRSDTITDSQRFYISVLDFLDDPDESMEVNELMAWWNRQIFPYFCENPRPIDKSSALARLKAKRKENQRLISIGA